MNMNKLINLLLLSTALLIFSCSDDSSEEPAPSTTNNGSGGSGGSGQNATLPSSIAGTTANMKFTAAQAGAPYTNDQLADFTFSAGGQMDIDDDPANNDGNEVTVATFEKIGSEYVWRDTQSGYDYSLSLTTNDAINEINVSSSGNFLGQFVPVGGSGGSSNLIANYAGTYTVSSVDHGSHSRMTVIIDNNGNIDFDSNTTLNYSDMELISDRIDCCQGIWIDMKPWPTEPYQRLNLFIDTNTNTPNKIEYFPEYTSINNRVTVNLTSGGSSGGNSGNSLMVSGDAAKVGGSNFSPAAGVECTSCINQKFTWTENVSSGPNKVFSIEIFSNDAVQLDFSASSAFRANGNDLSSVGLVGIVLLKPSLLAIQI